MIMNIERVCQIHTHVLWNAVAAVVVAIGGATNAKFNNQRKKNSKKDEELNTHRTITHFIGLIKC